MSEPIRSVLVAVKRGHGPALDMARQVGEVLAGLGVACEVREQPAAVGAESSGQVVPSHDLVLVLGGDGTFIAAARQMVARDIPLLGVNLGQVGFLAELSPSDWRSRLPGVIAGGYTVAPRLMLAYRVLRGGRQVHEGMAVNDIVISRGVLARLIRLGFAHDGQAVISMRSDGVIVSTPTGSTAYGVSAGGPLLVPGVNAFSVVPICPFLNGFKPLVLPADKRLEIEVQGDPGDVSITEDGQVIVDLRPGDVVSVVRGEHDLLLAETPEASYFEKLKTKGFLLER